MNIGSISDFQFEKYCEIVEKCPNVFKSKRYEGLKLCNNPENTSNFKICCPQNCFKIDIREMFIREGRQIQIPKKYIIKNCPAITSHSGDWISATCMRQDTCQDCETCLPKRIYECTTDLAVINKFEIREVD